MKNFYPPIITAILFSGSFVAAKYTTYDLGPLTTTFLRYVIALLFLSSLIFYYKPSSLKIKKEDILKIVLIGITGIIGYHYFFFSSLIHTYVTNTGIINAFSPVVTAILAAIFIKEKLTKKNYLGIFLALIGVLVLITRGKTESIVSLKFNYGDILMLLAVVSWAVYSLLIKSLSKKYSSFTLTFYATASSVVILLFLAIIEGGIKQLVNISDRSILSILYMGIFASGLGYLLYNFGIKDLGPTKTSSLVYSGVPVLVAILSSLVFEEALTFTMILSVLFIVGGLNAVLSGESKEDK